MVEIHNNRLSIFISSSDKFEWLWPPFFYYFRKFWPDCPYDIYLGTESENLVEKDIIILKSGKNLKWGEVTIRNISQIKSKYVLLLLDDYFLQSKVDTNMIQEILLMFEQVEAKYIKLTENHNRMISKSEIFNSFTQITDKDHFGISLQAAIWDREFLLDILDANESPWEFEKKVVNRISSFKGVYQLKNSAFDINFGGVMHFGAIERRFYKKTIKEGIDINKKYMMTRRQQTLKMLEDLTNNLRVTQFFPYRLRKFLKRVLGV